MQTWMSVKKELPRKCHFFKPQSEDDHNPNSEHRRKNANIAYLRSDRRSFTTLSIAFSMSWISSLEELADLVMLIPILH